MEKTAAPLLALLVSLAPGAAAQDAGTTSTPGAPASSGPPSALEGTRWRWVDFTGPGETTEVLVPRGRYALEFRSGGRLSFEAGCSDGFARYSTDGEQLRVEQVVATGCFGSSLSLRVQRALHLAASYHLQGDSLRLTLRDGAGVARLALERPAEAAELLDERWSWVGLLGGDGGTPSTAQPDAYWLKFMPEGRFWLRADCNRGRGTWHATSARTLALTVTERTHALCPEGSLSERYLQLLLKAASFRLEDGSMLVTLTPEAGSLRFVRAQPPPPK
jgi:heat shock protein HslJ